MKASHMSFFYFICHYLIIRLFYNKLQELIKEIDINDKEI